MASGTKTSSTIDTMTSSGTGPSRISASCRNRSNATATTRGVSRSRSTSPALHRVVDDHVEHRRSVVRGRAVAGRTASCRSPGSSRRGTPRSVPSARSASRWCAASPRACPRAGCRSREPSALSRRPTKVIAASMSSALGRPAPIDDGAAGAGPLRDGVEGQRAVPDLGELVPGRLQQRLLQLGAAAAAHRRVCSQDPLAYLIVPTYVVVAKTQSAYLIGVRHVPGHARRRTSPPTASIPSSSGSPRPSSPAPSPSSSTPRS